MAVWIHHAFADDMEFFYFKIKIFFFKSSQSEALFGSVIYTHGCFAKLPLLLGAFSLVLNVEMLYEALEVDKKQSYVGYFFI